MLRRTRHTGWTGKGDIQEVKQGSSGARRSGEGALCRQVVKKVQRPEVGAGMVCSRTARRRGPESQEGSRSGEDKAQTV